MTLTSIQLMRLKPDVVRHQHSCLSQVLRNIVYKIQSEAKIKLDGKMDCYHCNMLAILLLFPLFFFIVHFLCLASFTPQLYGIRIHEWHVIFFGDWCLLRCFYVFNVENDMTKLWHTNTGNSNVAPMTATTTTEEGPTKCENNSYSGKIGAHRDFIDKINCFEQLDEW